MSSGKAEPEGPARLAKQLALFSKALALVRGKVEVSEAEYVVLYRLAEDTLPRHKYTTLSTLISADSALKFELRAWTDRFDRWLAIKSDLNVAVYGALQAADMKIAIPQREVRLRPT